MSQIFLIMHCGQLPRQFCHAQAALVIYNRPVHPARIPMPNTPRSRLQSRALQQPPLHWLLLLSLLLQSVGPTALAASNVGGPGGDGIWTISCAGKPMWLPITHEAADSANGKHGNATSTLHCLICNNIAGTESLPVTAEHFDSTSSDAFVPHNSRDMATAASQALGPCQPRAPPNFLHG